MKIKLIALHEQSEDRISSAETFKIHKVNLPLLVALTPSEHSVKIVDGAFAPYNINEEVDLVGITLMIDLALRAYQIAETYRQGGIKVAMGGIHAMFSPVKLCNMLMRWSSVKQRRSDPSFCQIPLRDRCKNYIVPTRSPILMECQSPASRSLSEV